MKKFLLCLLAVGLIICAFFLGNNWNKITNTDTPPAQEEIVDDNNQEDTTEGDENQDSDVIDPEDNQDGITDIYDTPTLSIVIGG